MRCHHGDFKVASSSGNDFVGAGVQPFNDFSSRSLGQMPWAGMGWAVGPQKSRRHPIVVTVVDQTPPDDIHASRGVGENFPDID